jgi:peptidoglycan/LPS O-acetylase OafA/YrhL
MPALDGLRAFAVTAVIAYHLNLTHAGGGYLGVDVFFVLSGFLITGILIEERVRTGRIALKAFWARRARRLLPALLLMLSALALYVGLGSPGLDRSTLRPDALSTLLYGANWHLIFTHSSYFAQFSAPSPLLHTWSLAIEEQFYLLWPLILLLLLRVTRGSRRLLTGAILALAAGSAGLMALLYHPGVDPSRIYYGTDTRAFELLIGAALAVVMAGRSRPSRAGRRALHTAGFVAIGAVAAACATVPPQGWMWRGGLVAVGVLTAVVIASISLPRSGPLGAVLSLPPIRWIGIISYGLYLWHWPVIVLMTRAKTGLSVWPLRGAQIGTMLALATASYLLVERPIRRARWAGWKRWLTAPTAVLATAAAVVAATAVPSTVAAAVAPPATSPRPALAAATPTPSTSVMVVGGNTALSLVSGMEDAAGGHGLAVHNAAGPGCSMAEGSTADDLDGLTRPTTESAACRWRVAWPRQLQQWRPTVAYVSFGAEDTADHLIDGRWMTVGTPEWQAYYQGELAQVAALLGSGGARVVIATVPQYPQPSVAGKRSPTFADPVRVAALNAVYRSFADAHPEVTLYDMASQVAPGDLGDGPNLSRPVADRVADNVDATLSMIANPTIHLPPGRILSPADPLRVMIVGDSVMMDAAPGLEAALQATGVVKVVANDPKKWWGLTNNSGWKSTWPQLISEDRPELVLGSWSWDNGAAQADPAAYSRTVEQAMGMLLAPGDGVDGVAIMEFPPFGLPASDVDPAKAQQALAGLERGRTAWDSLMASLAGHWPGQYMFLPVANSLEVNGQYSTWLPGPTGVWSRARKTDNFHLCPTGAAALGQATLTQLTPVLDLPPPAASWWSGSWTKNSTYNDPSGSCPDDHP